MITQFYTIQIPEGTKYIHYRIRCNIQDPEGLHSKLGIRIETNFDVKQVPEPERYAERLLLNASVMLTRHEDIYDDLYKIAEKFHQDNYNAKKENKKIPKRSLFDERMKNI